MADKDNVYNDKEFNAEVVLGYYATVPRTRLNALLRSGALVNHPEYVQGLEDQTGGNYLSKYYVGRLDPSHAQNYNGTNDVDGQSVQSFYRGITVVGKQDEFFEYDFTYDITHTDFLTAMVDQLVDYEDEVNQGIFLSTLKGIEGVLPASHIIETGAVIKATDLITATQKACGDMRGGFALFVCHSAVSAQLEAQQLVEYMTYTDPAGITAPTTLKTINGRVLIEDDDCPFDKDSGTYTSYILGRGAIDFCNCGAAVPIETFRDPHRAGGKTSYIWRERVLFAPEGISYKADGTKNPDNADLENAGNWEIVKGEDGTDYPEKAIHIAILKTLAEEPEESGDNTTSTSADAGNTDEATKTSTKKSAD